MIFAERLRYAPPFVLIRNRSTSQPGLVAEVVLMAASAKLSAVVAASTASLFQDKMCDRRSGRIPAEEATASRAFRAMRRSVAPKPAPPKVAKQRGVSRPYRTSGDAPASQE